MTDRRSPRNAATVILVRQGVSEAFEVLLTRRPPKMDFLGGMYVFPGGTVRKEDWTEPMLKRCNGLSPEAAQRILGMDLGPEFSLGHWVAAIRELFEEVGILLCVTSEGRPIQMKESGRAAGIAAKREALAQGLTDFQSILESEDLLCDTARLSYFSHWLTPEEFPMRFNARFFLARLPADQSPALTSPEVTHSLWVTPEQSLKLIQEGRVPMIFPTFASLRTLANFDSLESLRAEFRLE
ncbi:MAG: NUDIX domain-containing protein [Deltaproteobacteria bacterium]|nr:NUDIX domain-containing protein [Deltaproteobacteria bacterium]